MRTTIGADEFAERRARATDAARERGLQGLMVCARAAAARSTATATSCT